MMNKERQTTGQMNASTPGTRLAAAMDMAGDLKNSLVRKSGLSDAAIRGGLKYASFPGIVKPMKLAKVTGINAACFWAWGATNETRQR